MDDDKKNISDAGKVAEPTKPGKVDHVKADSPGAGLARPGKGGGPG